jgi:SNF2 family DNA or RNA helicase
VWPKEIRTHCAVKSAIYFLVGLTPGGRLKVIENVVANIDQADHLRFLLVNYDLLDGLADELANLVKTVPTMLVLDESTAIKNPVAKRTAAACKIGSGAKYRIIMTGMPMTNTPLDVFSQFKFLHSGILGYDNYYAFRNRYCITGGFESHEIVAYVNLDELAEKVHKFSYRVKKSDCLDLPPKIFEARTIEMSPEQQGAYSRMAADFESEFIDGEIQITSHVITQIMRLRGITSGFQSKLVSETYVNGKTVRTFAPVPLGSNPKLNELESMVPELLSDPDTKVVVWCTFREEVRQIAGLFARLKIGFVEFHGGIEQHDREIAIDAFQTDPSVRVFLATVDSGGIGITLHAASTAIYFSKSYDLEHDAQSQDRLHRIGQKNNVTYISLVCAGTVDEAIEAALIGKRNMAAVITDKRSLIDFVRGRLSELMDAKR